jgi:hypothetical protein
MGPHRIQHTLHGSALASVRSLGQMPVDIPGAATAGVVAAVTWAIGAGNIGLLKLVLLAMLLDMVVGAVRAVDDPLQKFSTKRFFGGFIGKFFRILVIPTASLVDWLIVVSPFPVPEAYSSAFPVTAFALYGLVAAELTSVLNKFRDGGVAPELIAEIVRRLDKMRVGGEPPARRHYDVPAMVSEMERQKPVDDAPG